MVRIWDILVVIMGFDEEEYGGVGLGWLLFCVKNLIYCLYIRFFLW